MRVFMLTHNMSAIGGSYQRSQSLAKQLARLGNEVTLIASRREPGLRIIVESRDGVRTVQMADLFPERIRHGGLSPIDLLGRTIAVLGAMPDIVHGFDHRPCVSVPPLLARWLGRTRFVSDWADLWGEDRIAGERHGVTKATLGRADHHVERFIRRHADAVTAVTASWPRAHGP